MYKTRFEDGAAGTNPEELLAAAHAGCFTMAVFAIFSQKIIISTSLDTEATLTMEGLSILKTHLSITGIISGINVHDFMTITKDAEKNSPKCWVLNIPSSSEAHYKT